MGRLMNKYGQEVCDKSRLEMLLSTSHILIFDYRFLYQTFGFRVSFLTLNPPHGCISS